MLGTSAVQAERRISDDLDPAASASRPRPEIEIPVRVGSTGNMRHTFYMRTTDILVILTPNTNS
jgi:hypothetical protein